MFITNFQNFMKWKNITTKEVMENLDMFQERFVKVYEFV